MIRMIDITEKKPTRRSATASAKVVASQSLIKKIKNNELPKGDCLATAKVAGFLAAKNVPAIIPLCHQINLTHAAIEFKFGATFIEIISYITAHEATGVEMEALTAVSVAALTIYDMAKTQEKGIAITDVRLLEKTGGKSGDWRATKK